MPIDPSNTYTYCTIIRQGIERWLLKTELPGNSLNSFRKENHAFQFFESGIF